MNGQADPTIRERLRELAENATPGPWQLGRGEDGTTHFIAQHGWGGGGPNYYADSYYPQDEIDGSLIVEAVNALPALLDDLDTLERRAIAATLDEARLARAMGTWPGRLDVGGDRLGFVSHVAAEYARAALEASRGSASLTEGTK